MKLVNDNLGDGLEDFLKAACLSLVEVSAGPIYIGMSSGELHRLYAAFTGAGGHWSTFIISAKSILSSHRHAVPNRLEDLLKFLV